MKTILTNPLIVLGDFNIANFNILPDSTLLGTAVNIDQLTSFSQDTSVYTCCLLAPRRDSTPKFISAGFLGLPNPNPETHSRRRSDPPGWTRQTKRKILSHYNHDLDSEQRLDSYGPTAKINQSNLYSRLSKVG